MCVTDRPVDTDGGDLLGSSSPSPRPSPPEEACPSRRRIDTVRLTLYFHPLDELDFCSVVALPPLASDTRDAPELNRTLLMGSLRAPPAPPPLVGSARVLFGSGLRFTSARVLKHRGAPLLPYIFFCCCCYQLAPNVGDRVPWNGMSRCLLIFRVDYH